MHLLHALSLTTDVTQGAFRTSTQEVLALTLIVAGGKPSEIASHFKEAFQRYTTASGTRAPRSGVRTATRTMLLLADYCRGLGHHGEANYALMKAHFQACALSGRVGACLSSN